MNEHVSKGENTNGSHHNNIQEVPANTDGAYEMNAHDVWEALVNIEVEALMKNSPDKTEMQLLDEAVEIAKQKHPGEYAEAMKDVDEYNFRAS